MRPYSEDLRRRIVKARERGESLDEVSKRFSVSISSISRYTKLDRDTGTVKAVKAGRKEGSRLDPYQATLTTWIEKEPGLTLEQIAQRCREELGLQISIPGLWFRLKSYGLSYKKNDMRKGAEPS
jgi:transposase